MATKTPRPTVSELQRLRVAVPLVERQHALMEQLRICAPRPLTAGQVAHRLGVSSRTIERDVAMLREAGIPISVTRGRGGGYSFDCPSSLPAITFSPAEAGALVVTLSAVGPYASASAQSAMEKLLAAISLA